MEKISISKEELRAFLSSNKGTAYYSALALFESALVEEALIACRGNQLRASKMLGVCRNTLSKRIKVMNAVKKAV